MSLNTRALYWGFFQPFEFDTLTSVVKAATGEKPYFTISKTHPTREPDLDIFKLVKMAYPKKSPSVQSTKLYEMFLENHFLDFSIMYDRYYHKYCRFDIANHDLATPSEYYDAIRYYIDLFYNIIIQKKLSKLVMINPPHQGFDLILYFVFKQLGLDVFILYQTLIPNAFLCLQNKEDFGLIEKAVCFNSYGKYEVERKFQKSLFYMQSVNKNATNVGVKKTPVTVKEKPRNNLYIFWHNISQRLSFNRSYFWKIFKKRYWLILFDIVTEAAVFSFHSKSVEQARHLNPYKVSLHKYKENLKKYETDITLLGAHKYIYVPLHYQPELTTSAIGGIYNDQLLMLEKLAISLPKGWKIFAKENPKQEHYLRNISFFERISKINSVVFVSSQVNTYDLMKHCEFVATVTGTAGWEAITGGKHCVYFGSPWYRQFPGALEFSEDLDLENISKLVIDHTQVQAAVNSFAQKCNKGIISKPYIALADTDFSFEKNVEHLVKTFKSILSD